MFRRREYLATTGAAAGTLFAGCLAGVTGRGCDPVDPRDVASGVWRDISLPVPESELVKAAPKDAIQAIVDPAFGPDWSDVDERAGQPTSQGLHHDDLVIGLERAGRARAYPLQVLYTHEAVNDDLDGPIIATYCPICGSAVVAERVVGGRPTTFGVSGYLWRADLVLYDERTDSLWSQLLARAIRGPAVGASQALLSATVTTWEAWRDGHPDTDVLLPPPISTTLGSSLGRPYYLPFRTEQLFADRAEDAVDGHTAVKGLVGGGEARANPFPAIDRERVINDRLGGQPVLVGLGSGSRVVAYDRCVEGRVLRFEPAGEAVARAGGSRWSLDTGVALDGPLAGTELVELGGLPPLFLFAWRRFQSDTDVYGSRRRSPTT